MRGILLCLLALLASRTVHLVESDPFDRIGVDAPQTLNYYKSYGPNEYPSDYVIRLSNGRGYVSNPLKAARIGQLRIRSGNSTYQLTGSDWSTEFWDVEEDDQHCAHESVFGGGYIKIEPLAITYQFRDGYSTVPLNWTFTHFMPVGHNGYVAIMTFTNIGDTLFEFYLYTATHVSIGFERGQVRTTNDLRFDQANSAFIASDSIFPTLWLVIGADRAPTAYRATTENFTTVYSTVGSARPIPPDFNRSKANGDVKAYLSYRFSIQPNQTEKLVFLYAFSGDVGTASHALEEFNYLKNNADRELKKTLGRYSEYLESTTQIRTGDTTLDLAYKWSEVVAKMSETEHGLFVLGWDGYWARDTLWATLGLLAIGDFEAAYKQLKLFKEGQKDSGGIPTVMFPPERIGGSVDSIDATPTWIIAAYYYLIFTGDKTAREEFFPAIAKAANWIITHYNATLELVASYGWNAGINNVLQDEFDNIHPYLLPPRVAAPLCSNVLSYQSLINAYNLLKNETYLQWANRLKENINKRLWQPDKGFYAGFLDTTNNIKYPGIFETPGNLAAVIFGVADREQAISILRKISEFSIPTPVVNPQYLYPSMQTSNANDTFQNGGAFAFNTAYTVWAYLAQDDSKRTVETLLQFANITAYVEPMAFAEWVTTNITTLHPEGSGFPAGNQQHIWAAGMYAFVHTSTLAATPTPDALSIPRIADENRKVEISNLRYRQFRFEITRVGNEKFTVKSQGSGYYNLKINLPQTEKAQIQVKKDGKTYGDWQFNSTSGLLTINQLESGVIEVSVERATYAFWTILFAVATVAIVIVIFASFLTLRKKREPSKRASAKSVTLRKTERRQLTY